MAKLREIVFIFFKQAYFIWLRLVFCLILYVQNNRNSTFSLIILLAAFCRVLFIPTHHHRIYGHMSVLFLIHVMSCFMSVSLSCQFSTNWGQWHFAVTKAYSPQSLLVQRRKSSSARSMSEFILFPDVNSSFLSEQHIITRYCIQMFQSTSRTAKRVSLS